MCKEDGVYVCVCGCGCVCVLSMEILISNSSYLILVSIYATWQANAASGMAVHDDCKLKFLELKAKRTYRFIVYKIEEKQKQVIVEKLGEPTDSYEDFSASLPANECRYAVYDFDFMTEENVPRSRIVFIAWYSSVFLSLPCSCSVLLYYCLLCFVLLLIYCIMYEGPLMFQRWEARWFMQALRIGLRESWMVFRWSCKLLILPRWALMLLKAALCELCNGDLSNYLVQCL